MRNILLVFLAVPLPTTRVLATCLIAHDTVPCAAAVRRSSQDGSTIWSEKSESNSQHGNKITAGLAATLAAPAQMLNTILVTPAQKLQQALKSPMSEEQQSGGSCPAFCELHITVCPRLPGKRSSCTQAECNALPG